MAILGGALMLANGLGTRSFLLTALSLLGGEIPQYLGGLAGLTATLVVDIIALLIALGGVTVALGGFSMLLRHVTTGRTLVLLGGGAGFFGLLISFAYTTLTFGLERAVSSAPYWLGLVLAIIARRLVKGA